MAISVWNNFHSIQFLSSNMILQWAHIPIQHINNFDWQDDIFCSKRIWCYVNYISRWVKVRPRNFFFVNFWLKEQTEKVYTVNVPNKNRPCKINRKINIFSKWTFFLYLNLKMSMYFLDKKCFSIILWIKFHPFETNVFFITAVRENSEIIVELVRSIFFDLKNHYQNFQYLSRTIMLFA